MPIAPKLTELKGIVSPEGVNNKLVADSLLWLKPVYELLGEFSRRRYSFSVSILRYGHEPATLEKFGNYCRTLRTIITKLFSGLALWYFGESNIGRKSSARLRQF